MVDGATHWHLGTPESDRLPSPMPDPTPLAHAWPDSPRPCLTPRAHA
jgi:hypothetical protein